MVFEKIREALASQFEADADTITMETNIIEDLGADSLDLVELIMSLEEEYAVNVTDEAIYACKTVGEIVQFIEAQLDK